jgi:hypothetical protein
VRLGASNGRAEVAWLEGAILERALGVNEQENARTFVVMWVELARLDQISFGGDEILMVSREGGDRGVMHERRGLGVTHRDPLLPAVVPTDREAHRDDPNGAEPHADARARTPLTRLFSRRPLSRLVAGSLEDASMSDTVLGDHERGALLSA